MARSSLLFLPETPVVTRRPEFRYNPLIKNPETQVGQPSEEFRVIIIDNDTNTYEEVIQICMLALGIDYEDAYHIALAVDHNGECAVYEGPIQDASEIAETIRSIGIEVRLMPVIQA